MWLGIDKEVQLAPEHNFDVSIHFVSAFSPFEDISTANTQ